ncbi:MAG: ADP-ribosylglycohydrolase family protein, partial [Pseudomonadota bacterium]
RATLDAMAKAEAAERPIIACGADDAQLPAVSKLPALVARHWADDDLMEKVESAVRLTNDRDDSVLWGRAVATMIRAAITGATPSEAVEAARGLGARTDAQIDAALSMKAETTAAVATAHALHCQLEVAYPVLTHAIATATDFAAATRANILAGGDNCGRAIPIGAVLGACFAGDPARDIPAEWIARVDVPGDLAALI